MAPGLFDFAMASGRIAGKPELHLHLLRVRHVPFRAKSILCDSRIHVVLSSVC